ncbi:EI24 domain-containing protein [Amnibacterium endophyticum]|uniref:EI24 domain-containing protein n=1 Tax=Amnibacterium endophyticum TaxID=2109337 RepID=A0ABW4LGJ7_9MICO
MRSFLAGIGDLGGGFRFWLTHPRLMLLGAVPALIVGAVWAGLLIWLLVALDGLAAAVTPFAAEWVDPWRTVVRGLAALALLVVALVVAALTFTAVVLTVADPFYERISRGMEEHLGDPPEARDVPLLPGLARAARDGARLTLASVGVGVLVLLPGLAPVAGAAIATVVGAVLGGRLLALELTGTPFDARGIGLAGRRAALRGCRARALGFGVAVYLLFLIPLGAVVATPAAVGGAVRLTRAALAAAR